LRILFIGDIVGKIGRRIVKEKTPYFISKYGIDFVIANGENATHGKGLIRHHYNEIIDAGVDVITLGNHYDSKSELARYIERVDCLVRPANLIRNYPGYGTALFDVDGVSVRVTNILGSAFINEEVTMPYSKILEILDEEEKADIHIVDFHAEATGEKKSFAFACDGKVSAVLGTHTHVQTRDARILPNGTAFISDVGMCGYVDGVLGFDKDSVVNKLQYGLSGKFTIPDEGRALYSAIVLDIDDITGETKEIFTIYLEEEK
jgi:metallophosphoesterase (TIGR00282 family)